MGVHLAIAVDSNYYNPFCALLASILHHHARGTVHIHAIATGIDEQRLKRITDLVLRNGQKIRFYSIADSRLNKLVTMSTWTAAVYYRLYFPLLIDEAIDRLIYLDSDTIILKNLEKLYTTSLDEFPVAAVYDNYVGVQPLIGILEEGEYFNSGVLLMDIIRWRQQAISEKTIDYLMKYPERIKFVDQCALNAVLQNNWKKLDISYNLLYSFIPQEPSKKESKLFIEDKTILHFTLQRPWLMLCKNRYRYLYKHYLKMSGLQQGRTIKDFSLKKLPKWMRLRIIEYYHGYPLQKKIWQVIKRWKPV